MKTLISVLVAVLLLSTAATVKAHTEKEPFSTDLIAGNPKNQVNDVGDVLVWNDGTNLSVQYVIDTAGWEGWGITKTHLHVANSLDQIPQKNGNPIPGQFGEKNKYDYATDPPALSLELKWPVGTELYIAAHADVGIPGGLKGLELTLPDQVTVMVQYPYAGGPSYFPGTVVSGGTNLDGTYDAWCVDTDHIINQNIPYTAKVYSSYEALPGGLIEFPGNLDLINWILNNDYVGQNVQDVFPETSCTGIITYGDVQRAIWDLIEDTQSTSGLGSWSPCRVSEIVDDALAYGDGFKPGCGDVVGVILAPLPICSKQFILIVVDVPCGVDETAWGAVWNKDKKVYQYDFTGKNWALYFKYTVQ